MLAEIELAAAELELDDVVALDDTLNDDELDEERLDDDELTEELLDFDELITAEDETDELIIAVELELMTTTEDEELDETKLDTLLLLKATDDWVGGGLFEPLLPPPPQADSKLTMERLQIRLLARIENLIIIIFKISLKYDKEAWRDM